MRLFTLLCLFVLLTGSQSNNRRKEKEFKDTDVIPILFMRNKDEGNPTNGFDKQDDTYGNDDDDDDDSADSDDDDDDDVRMDSDRFRDYPREQEDHIVSPHYAHENHELPRYIYHQHMTAPLNLDAHAKMANNVPGYLLLKGAKLTQITNLKDYDDYDSVKFLRDAAKSGKTALNKRKKKKKTYDSEADDYSDYGGGSEIVSGPPRGKFKPNAKKYVDNDYDSEKDEDKDAEYGAPREHNYYERHDDEVYPLQYEQKEKKAQLRTRTNFMIKNRKQKKRKKLGNVGTKDTNKKMKNNKCPCKKKSTPITPVDELNSSESDFIEGEDEDILNKDYEASNVPDTYNHKDNGIPVPKPAPVDAVNIPDLSKRPDEAQKTDDSAEVTSQKPKKKKSKSKQPPPPGGIGSIGQVINEGNSGVMTNQWIIEQLKEIDKKENMVQNLKNKAPNSVKIKSRMCILNSVYEYCIGEEKKNLKKYRAN